MITVELKEADMDDTLRDPQRPILLDAIRGLITAARSERATLAEDAPERQFFLGVETAALEVLHPELQSTRTDEWLDREPPAFREGYLRASTLIAHATASERRPLRLLLPSPLPG